MSYKDADQLLAEREADFNEAIDDLNKARAIIRDLLKVPTPTMWRKWKGLRVTAKSFLEKLDQDLG